MDRTAVKSKVAGLVQTANSYIQICKHEEKVQNLFKKYYIAQYVNLFKNIAFMLCIVLNIFILLTFAGTYDPTDRMYN